jgi:(E)-4-hydroxy-3-methylbut-2-enyl-diphosphate synthase
MKPKRKRTRRIYVGSVPVGGGSPIAVQSMTKTDTRDVSATVRQIRSLERAGCEIIRLAVPDREAARCLGKIKRSVSIPVVADIHFDWRLALEAARQGVDGLRINPGNIGAGWKVREVVEALKDRGMPLRIGVNAGSLEKDLRKKYGHPVPEALVESAARQIDLLEGMGYGTIKVSLKASDVLSTVSAYRAFSRKYRYPLHIGISEAGPLFQGLVKSSVGLGLLLSEGIGDTVRVSLTERPEEEVRAAYEILRALRIRERGVDIVSCPTCGRCRVDLKGLVREAQKKLRDIDEPITVAVMGCAVNGPGEAREADFGIASGAGMGLVFKKGKVVAKAKEEKLTDTLLREITGDII